MNGEKRLTPPQRWINCPRYGDPVPRTPFIPLKAPLCDKYSDLYEKHRFTFSIFQEEQRELGHEINCIISLANTKNFYSEEDLNGVKWIHIPCRGHEQAPTKDEYENFLKAVDEVGALPTGVYIAVHCTHGFNRTGFCITRYLVDRVNMSLPDALETFASCRKPGIYKNDYIEVLYQIYGLSNPPKVEKPKWEFPDPATLPHFLVSEPIVNETQTLETIGKFIRDSTITTAISKICDYGFGKFPGSNPISITAENKMQLTQQRYLATYKSDGVRYFLYAYRQHTYLIDRKNSIRKVNVTLVNRKGKPLENTLLDGELVESRGDTKPHFLIFDVLCFEGLNLIHHTWDLRMDYSKKGVVAFRNLYFKRNQEAFNREDFHIEEKLQWELQNISDLEEYIKTSVTHNTDGAIFTPLDLQFVPGRCDQILKMKPIELNSTDFKVSLKDGICYLSVTNYVEKGSERVPENIPISILDLGEGVTVKDGAICEAVLDITQEKIDEDPINCWFKAGWKPLRIREDKDTPNVYTTFAGVFKSIEDNINFNTIAKMFPQKGASE